MSVKTMAETTASGIKVDVLLGDFDHGSDAEYYKNTQYPIEIVHAPNQDKTDLEKAFDYLIERNIPAANVIWATGKRADHTITNITLLAKFRNQLKIVIFDDHSKIFLLPNRYEKWYPQNTTLSLIPIGTVDGIHSENLVYPLQNDSLLLGYRSGSSNQVAQDGIVTIKHSDGDLLLMECWD